MAKGPKKSALEGLRRRQPGNDPNLTSKFEARFYGVNEQTLGPSPTASPFPNYPGTPGGGAGQYVRFLPESWTQFLSSPDLNWLYEEPVAQLDNSVTRQQLPIVASNPNGFGVAVPSGQTLVILEWTPQMFREVDFAVDLVEPVGIYEYSFLVAANLNINGRAPIAAHTNFFSGSTATAVTGTKFMNTRAFVNDPTFPVCLYVPENGNLTIEFKYREANHAALLDANLYIGSKLLGFFAPTTVMDEIFAKARGMLHHAPSTKVIQRDIAERDF